MGIEQENEIWLHEQMVYKQSRICPGERDSDSYWILRYERIT